MKQGTNRAKWVNYSLDLVHRNMRLSLLLSLFLLISGFAEAKHITGGEVIYDYLGPGSAANTKRYKVTLFLYRDNNCVNCAVMPANVSLGVFNNNTGSMVGGYITINLMTTQAVPIITLPGCITNPPNLSYTVGSYELTIELADNSLGYTVTYQTCCRIDGIRNIPDMVGATYSCTIPGITNKPLGFTDSGPRFSKGINIICYEKPFTLDFSATDPNGDSLSYYFCSAYNGGAASDASFSQPAPPPYGTVSYINGFNGNFPLGPQATINPQTGIISGIAPDAGKYVISVCVDAYRNGIYITTHRKDFIITVAPCDYAGAMLNPTYITCDGFNFTFLNLNHSPLNNSFYWDFGDGNSSTEESPTHLYSAAGVYPIKLVVNRNEPCGDSTTAMLSVFPGYFPEFSNSSPICKDRPVAFQDLTTANYGVASEWSWNFGDPSTNADTSHLKNPTYTYSNPGTYQASLIVKSTKGCIDTISRTVTIVEKPVFSVTNDTLICDVDTLQLSATSSSPGNVTWSPNYAISNIHSFTPLVSPDVSTTYYVNFSDNTGCEGNDSVKVNVVDHVTLNPDPDQTICRTDTIMLNPGGDGLRFEWTPATGLSNPLIKNPLANPTAPSTTYTVTAHIGKCSATDQITIKTVPYPTANVSDGVSLCLGNSTTLSASGGSMYFWTPPNYLSNPNVANPTVINPLSSIVYTVGVTDTLGCPKPAFASVAVQVIQLIADAGPRDTSVVINQPLQLLATGGDQYNWSPPLYLNNPNSGSPVSLPEDNISYVLTATNSVGCTDTDTIDIKVYKMDADIYVPSGFSPNNDGLNDILKPLALGMKTIEYFMIYNRWGQLLYSTSSFGEGWNGTFGGKPQDTGTYIWRAAGIDYLNKRHEKKGTVVLIR